MSDPVAGLNDGIVRRNTIKSLTGLSLRSLIANYATVMDLFESTPERARRDELYALARTIEAMSQYIYGQDAVRKALDEHYSRREPKSE